MVTAGFERPIPAIKQLQTYALDGSAIGIGYLFIFLFLHV
jgi:hypothetical protein